MHTPPFKFDLGRRAGFITLANSRLVSSLLSTAARTFVSTYACTHSTRQLALSCGRETILSASTSNGVPGDLGSHTFGTRVAVHPG